MNTIIKRALISVGILAVAVVIAVLLVNSREEPATLPPQPRTPLVQTVPAELRTGALEVQGAGVVRARDEAAVAAQVSGRVVYVAPEMESGGRVRQGQVLVRIDPADFENRVAQAQADVATQDVAVLQAVEEAELAKEEFDRFTAREAARSPFASVDSNDYAARLLPDQGATAGESANTTAREPSPLTLRQPQLDAARAARQRAAAALSDAELALARTEVRAPFDGIVRTETVALGDIVGAAQPFARIIASAGLEAVIPLSDDQASLITNLYSGGAKASVATDYGRLRYEWDAVVDRVDATLDEAARTFNVVLRVPSPLQGRRVEASAQVQDGAPAVVPSSAPPLFVGSYVDAAIEGADLGAYAVIPRGALRRGGAIWTIENAGGETQLRVVPVAIVQEVGEDVFVTGDLSDGMPIVTTDLTGVVDGMAVRLSGETSPTTPAASTPTN
ncbi:MAG: HlyD family efflux transporter periplasmic adaptor subunit [Bacteroidota bacterium]